MSFKGKEGGGVPEYDSIEGYGRYASRYDAQDGTFLDAFDKKILMRVLRDLSGKRVIDIGAGTGRLGSLIALRGAQYSIATDLSPHMLAQAKAKEKYDEYIIWDVCDEPPVGLQEQCDVLICSLVLVHIHHRDIAKVIQHMGQVLKKGGQAYIVNIPQRRAPLLQNQRGEKFYISSYHHADATVQDEMEQEGFHIEGLLHGMEHDDVISTLFVAHKK